VIIRENDETSNLYQRPFTCSVHQLSEHSSNLFDVADDAFPVLIVLCIFNHFM